MWKGENDVAPMFSGWVDSLDSRGFIVLSIIL